MADSLRSRGSYLAVNIRLKTAADESDFLQRMKTLMPMFTDPPRDDGEGFGWSLAISGQIHSWDQNQAQPEFFNLWKLHDPLKPSIWDAMRAAAANSDYILLDDLVETEVQDLLHTTDVYTPTAFSPDQPGTIYVREQLQMTADPTAFENRMPVVAYEARQACDAELLLGLLNVTGRLRTFTNIWRLQAHNQEQLLAFLKNQKVYKEAVVRQSADTLTVIDYRSIEVRRSGIVAKGAPEVVRQAGSA